MLDGKRGNARFGQSMASVLLNSVVSPPQTPHIAQLPRDHLL